MNADGGPRRRKPWRLKLKTIGKENSSNASTPNGTSWPYTRRAKRRILPTPPNKAEFVPSKQSSSGSTARLLLVLGRVLINNRGPDVRFRGIKGHRKAAFNRSKMARSGQGLTDLAATRGHRTPRPVL